MTLPGSRCKALGTLQRPSLLASCHLLLPRALAISHCLVPACCIHVPPALCTPLADRHASSQLGMPLLPKGILHQPKWGIGVKLHGLTDTDLPDSTTPPLSHPGNSDGTDLDAGGSGG